MRKSLGTGIGPSVRAADIARRARSTRSEASKAITRALAQSPIAEGGQPESDLTFLVVGVARIVGFRSIEHHVHLARSDASSHLRRRYGPRVPTFWHTEGRANGRTDRYEYGERVDRDETPLIISHVAGVLARFLVIALSVVVMTSGCTRVGQIVANGRTHHPWTRPDLLRIAMIGSPNTLNPLLSTQQFEAQAEALVFDPLISRDGHGHDVPILAARVPTLANGDVSRDGLRIRYRLRRDVLWQDGAPFSSRDVAFTWQAIMNPKSAVANRHGYDDVSRVETPDPYTAIFVLRRPFAPAVDTFFAPSDSPLMILPAHLLERYGSLDRLAFNAQPIGTGPYRVLRWIRNDRIEYERNDRYFLGRPHIRSVVLHIVPDENTIVNEMRSHELDWFIEASPRVYPQLRGLANVAIRLVPINANEALEFNVTRAPWSDVRLRRAVGFVLDKSSLVEKVTFGSTIPATEDLPPISWAFDPHAGTSKADPALAGRLFDAAGWHLRPDGFRYRNGERLTLELTYRSDTLTDRNLSVVLASMLLGAGIDVSLKGYETSLYFGPAGNGILADGRYQSGLMLWYAGIDPDDSSQLICSERPPAGYNWARYCSTTMDGNQRAALSHYDRATRIAAYSRIERLLAADAPFVYLWWPRQIEAISDDLHGFEPNGVIEDWNAYRWSLDSAKT